MARAFGAVHAEPGQRCPIEKIIAANHQQVGRMSSSPRRSSNSEDALDVSMMLRFGNDAFKVLPGTYGV
jgi:hypothetical protein